MVVGESKSKRIRVHHMAALELIVSSLAGKTTCLRERNDTSYRSRLQVKACNSHGNDELSS
jgi:hypothetical protein